MTSTAKRLLEEVLALPQEEREELVGAVSSSLDAVELSAEWEAEIARRVRKIETGEAVFQDAGEHLQKLRVKYGG